MFIKQVLRRIVPKRVKEFLTYDPKDFYSKKSFSQEGEDLMLDIMINYKEKGTYVDIGAHHPYKFSNTYFYYLKGWSGVCVDPIPSVGELFNKFRPKDKFVNKGIGLQKEVLSYYEFEDPALNTMDKEVRDKRINQGHIFSAETKIKTDTLTAILDETMEGKFIDFMSIDVEGLELQVLMSNDWKKYRPVFLIIHYKSKNIDDCLSSKISVFLNQKGYRFYAKSFHSIFYKIRA